jgi:AcrR family transcriptional regulator
MQWVLLGVGIDNIPTLAYVVTSNIAGDPMAYHHGNLHEALLERAAEVIAESGIEAVSLRGLARDLGVSHAAPCRHFADRRALLVELARDGLRRSIDAMNEGAERAGSDPVARYRALGRSYVQFAREHPSYFRAINHPEVLAQAGDDLDQAKRAWFATLREGAHAAQDAGWHSDSDPDALIAFSIAAAMGAATLLSDNGWCALLGVDDIDGLADAVLDLTVHRAVATAGPTARPVKKTNERKQTRKAS